jgi:uncharacterized protein YggE
MRWNKPVYPCVTMSESEKTGQPTRTKRAQSGCWNLTGREEIDMERKHIINRPIVLLSLLAVVLMLVTACSDGIAAGAPAATPDNSAPEHTISVSGNGEATGTPNVAYVELGVNVTNPDVGQAIAEANQTMNDVRQALLDAGVPEENLQTSTFNVSAEQPPTPQDPTQQSELIYRVVNILRVKVVQIETVSDVIDAGLNAGANSVYSLSFDIDDPTALQEQARAAAIEDARNRAQQLADGLGVQLGAPVQVSESFGGQPQIERVAMAADAAGAGAPPISEGQLAVSVTVNVSFLIEEAQ